LNFLAGEFRIFLSLFTGENCRAMTAGEFSRSSPLGEWGAGDSPLGADFLGAFFRRCDNLRFSGAGISSGELLDILGNLRLFIEALNAAFFERRSAGPAAPGGSP
jgi:hypothetical protein